MNRRDILLGASSLADDTIMSDVGKSLDFLAGRSEINANGIGVIGFCMGGRSAFLTNAVLPTKIKAAISFYGGGIDATAGNPLGQNRYSIAAPQCNRPSCSCTVVKTNSSPLTSMVELLRLYPKPRNAIFSIFFPKPDMAS